MLPEGAGRVCALPHRQDVADVIPPPCDTAQTVAAATRRLDTMNMAFSLGFLVSLRAGTFRLT
jgi:hypothetical protein